MRQCGRFSGKSRARHAACSILIFFTVIIIIIIDNYCLLFDTARHSARGIRCRSCWFFSFFCRSCFFLFLVLRAFFVARFFCARHSLEHAYFFLDFPPQRTSPQEEAQGVGVVERACGVCVMEQPCFNSAQSQEENGGGESGLMRSMRCVATMSSLVSSV